MLKRKKSTNFSHKEKVSMHLKFNCFIILKCNIKKIDQVISVDLSNLAKKDIDTLWSARVKARFLQEALVTLSEKSSTLIMRHNQVIYPVFRYL